MYNTLWWCALTCPILWFPGLPEQSKALTWFLSPILGLIFTPLIGSANFCAEGHRRADPRLPAGTWPVRRAGTWPLNIKPFRQASVEAIGYMLGGWTATRLFSSRYLFKSQQKSCSFAAIIFNVSVGFTSSVLKKNDTAPARPPLDDEADTLSSVEAEQHLAPCPPQHHQREEPYSMFRTRHMILTPPYYTFSFHTTGKVVAPTRYRFRRANAIPALIQMGCWGLVIYAATAAIAQKYLDNYDLSIKIIYILGTLGFSIGTAVMFIFPNVYVSMIMISTMGIVSMSISYCPYALLGQYHEMKEYIHHSPGNSKRGFGIDCAILSCQVYISQILVASALGAVVDFVSTVRVIPLVASIGSFLGFLTAAFLVIYPEVPDENKEEAKRQAAPDVTITNGMDPEKPLVLKLSPKGQAAVTPEVESESAV
ncbi:hypothetical protein GDO81_020367 [Engystomops pustulosus]|uniref:Solute carrier family 45 member 4 n=1 Tax=Engystomops pustulosus TaxID=76066 RepID=A0AAV6ZJQ7_ENGPU|nr:hypothetical protein GDO81_020367 [Engystomops pustulosus]